eukprot:11166152-Lingulodinium_polyedra.AAC.1
MMGWTTVAGAKELVDRTPGGQRGFKHCGQKTSTPAVAGGPASTESSELSSTPPHAPRPLGGRA